MFNVIKSLIITLTISIGLAFSFRQAFGFWECFVTITIVQFLIGFIFKNKKIQQEVSLIEELTDNLEALIEKQQVLIECPCGKNTIPAIVFYNEETILECDKCNKKLKIITDIQTQLITDTVNMESIYNKLKGTSV